MDAAMINKIQKAKEYAEQPERVTFNSLTVHFRGDNSSYTINLGPEGWSCSCPGFSKYGICPHIMALESIFKPMLKRDPLPYATGQNIVSDVNKAKRYADEKDRMEILNFNAKFEGKNKDHMIGYDDGTWTSTSDFFQSHGICSHTMAMERILKDMVKPVTSTSAEAIEAE
ncbi:hypothetical protein MASR2M15_10570 [Anaerolineales bacterium]